MGYSTQFDGELKFTKELTATQLAAVKQFCGEDCRDHSWIYSDDLTYIDVELLDDFSGIKWNGAEKTYKMEHLINVIIHNMRQRWDDFGLTGSLIAQGDEHDDRWLLEFNSEGIAMRKKMAVIGTCVTCPHCEAKFIPMEGED